MTDANESKHPPLIDYESNASRMAERTRKRQRFNKLVSISLKVGIFVNPLLLGMLGTFFGENWKLSIALLLATSPICVVIAFIYDSVTQPKTQEHSEVITPPTPHETPPPPAPS